MKDKQIDFAYTNRCPCPCVYVRGAVVSIEPSISKNPEKISELFIIFFNVIIIVVVAVVAFVVLAHAFKRN